MSNASADPAALRRLAHEYYEWRDADNPVITSGQGGHRYDDRLTDYSPQAVSARRAHISELLSKVKATSTEGWSRDDRVDAILFQAQLEGATFSTADASRLRGSADLRQRVHNAIFGCCRRTMHRIARAHWRRRRVSKRCPHAANGANQSDEAVKLYAQLAIQAGTRRRRALHQQPDDLGGRAVGERAQASRRRRATAAVNAA
jgi:uncharacterized protein (DUF885 family)